MSALRGVLFIGAHPDDETIMAGGTLALLAERGIPTGIVCATDGRGGEAGGVPEATTPDALARVRLDELRCAAEALRVARVLPLGYEDPLIGPDEELFSFAANEDYLVAQLAEAIQTHAADVVLTHGSDGEYGHPAHKQLHVATLRAAREYALDAVVYSAMAALPGMEDRIMNQSDPAHLALDVTPWADEKLAAMLCHRTQHALFKRRRKLTHVREALRLTESFRRQFPPSDTPDDAFARLLIEAGAWRAARQEDRE